MTKPLTGYRILTVEQYGAGPFGTQHLADLGAEVIKVENHATGGDYARDLGPFFVGPPEDRDTGLFFQSFNRNKRSLTLDLSRPEGQQVFHRLVAQADAVANNLRGDVPDKLGLTYDALKGVNPKIVCGHCSAYGRDGSRRTWPGYDYLMQAEAGYFHLTGEADGPPTRMGLSIVDYMGGTYLALGIAAALAGVAKTGLGRDVDVDLFSTAFFNLSYLGAWTLNHDYAPDRAPRSAHPSIVPCQMYRTADGWIYLMMNKDRFWPELCAVIGHPDLAGDARFATMKDRLAHRDDLTTVLDGILMTRTTDAWLQAFAGKLPAAPILTPEQALDSDFAAERGLVQTLERDGAPFRMLSSPFGADPGDRPAPKMGADTDEVLRQVGLSDAQIKALRAANIV